jgi:hypothetical protein
MGQGFRNLSTQLVTGFLVSFFANYQPQFASETKRFSVAVIFLIVIPLFAMLLSIINNIKPVRFFFLKTYLSTLITILQYISVWIFISIVSKSFGEALESVFNFDSASRLITSAMFVALAVALLETPPKPENSEENKTQ